jgi:GNAT superfamily N-acetyltransferase
MIQVREAAGHDVAGITEIFLSCYGKQYPVAHFYDPASLTKLVYSDDTLLLVAEDVETKQLLGTASVILEVGAYSDLVGEFGRLAVRPEARQRGVGALLMSERLRRVQDRLQVGLVEARAAHPFSQKIAQANGFACVGFLPMKYHLHLRESLVLLVRYFGNALELRKNHPRIIPEIHPLAHLALENCSLPPDAIVDEEAPAYPPGRAFDLQELTTEGYSALLRIERGRVRHREIFGPMSLHYGFFKLRARQSRYLLAREAGRIAGAIGFTLDPVEKLARVFELIVLYDGVVRPLLASLDRLCREEFATHYVEIDVSAYAPRMQRTLVELGFLPAAYIPALVFHHVERLDVVRMVRLLAPLDVTTQVLTPASQRIADVVLCLFRSRTILPRIAEAVGGLPLFSGLSAEQVQRLAGVCRVAQFPPGEVVFRHGDAGREMHVVLSGEVDIRLADGTRVGVVHDGECLGEISLLTAAVHSATAVATTALETAVLGHDELAELVRLRPDVGLVVYRNLALGLAAKLKRAGGAGGRG